jgi:O-antigen ligase
MKELIRAYNAKPWSKLEIPTMGKAQRLVLVVYVAAMVALGWYIYLSGPLALHFLYLGLGIPILFLFKSRYLAIAGLLSLEVVMAFMFMGNSTYIISTVMIFAGVIIAFESPVLVYVFLVFWMWFEMSPYSGFVGMKNELLLLATLFMGWLFRYMFSRTTASVKIYFKEKIPVLLLSFWILLGLAVWCIERAPAGIYQVKYFLIGVMFFILTPLIIRDEKTHTTITWAWVFVGILGAITAFIQPGAAENVESQVESFGAASAALGIQHSWSASFLSLSLFITISMFYVVKGVLKKAGIIFSVFFMIVALWIQYSKGVTIGFFIGLSLFWLITGIWHSKHNKGLVFVSRIFLIACTLTLVYIATTQLEFNLGTYNVILTNPSGGSMEVRYLLWSKAYTMIMTEGHAVRGLGAGAFWALAHSYQIDWAHPTIPHARATESMDFAELGINPHNLYVDTILHYGIVGFALLLWLLIGNFMKLRRGMKYFQNPKFRYLCLGIMCALIAFYFSCLFDFGIFFITRVWLFLGFAVATVNIGIHLEGTKTAELIEPTKKTSSNKPTDTGV